MAMTKKEVIREVRELIKDMPEMRGDDAAKREFWNNYTDMLREDRRITNYQYNNWDNPF